MGAGLSQDQEESERYENHPLPGNSQPTFKLPVLDTSSTRKPLQQNKKRKAKNFSIVKKHGSFTLSAQDLSITWGEEPRHWHWYPLKEPSEEGIIVAKANTVSWLEVHGKFDTAKLLPGTVYEVVFDVKLQETAFGWKVPVNLRLTLPGGRKQEHKENLMEKPTEEWIEIPAGVFKTTTENIGVIEFSLYEFKGGGWKKGLIIKGVSFNPKP